MKGLLSKEYAKERAKLIMYDQNNAMVGPGDPYPFEGRTNPFADLLKERAKLGAAPSKGGGNAPSTGGAMNATAAGGEELYYDRVWRGNNSIEGGDKDGWVNFVPPCGGLALAFVRGYTWVGLGQRIE